MPDAPIQEPPPAESQTVAPTGADPKDPVIPENVRTLLDNLNLDPEGDRRPKDPKAEPKTAPEPKTSAAPKEPKTDPKDPKAATPPATPETDPALRVRKPKVARPELPLVPAPAAPVAKTKDEPFKPDPQWESTLDEEQREMLSDARFMEERFPDKYKGWAARTAKFLKEHGDLAAKEGFDPNSAEFKTWLDKNQPRLSREQIREIEEVRVADRVKKEYDGKLADVQHKLFVREHEPKLEQEGRTLFAELTNTALPEGVAKAIKEEGFDKASEVYGMEIETAQNVLGAVTEDLMELRRITLKDPETGRPLQPVATDPSHPKFAQHQRLSQLVADVDETFKNTASAEQQQRDGKWFVTRDEWNSIRPDQRHRFWTFSNVELIAEAKKAAKNAVHSAIERRREQLRKLGWQPPAPKTAPVVQPPKADPPQPTHTPKIPAAVPTPGASDGVPAEIEARAKRLAAHLSS